jgi:UDP-glucose 4-epimerase
MQKGTVLITGIGGFVGSSLAHRLVREGYTVIGVCGDIERARTRVPQEVRLHGGDIRSLELHSLFQGVDVVFHLAARSVVAECQQDPAGTMDINVVGTANVFEAARRANVRKVVYASSALVEESARQHTFYAISKAMDEKLAEGFAAAGLATVGLRYFNIYGPGQDYRPDPPVISRFITALTHGERPIVFEGYADSPRDFIYIDDVHDFHLLCINDNRVDNRIFGLGSGIQYTTVEILSVLQKILGTHLDPIVKTRTSIDPPSPTLADIRDARALGWEPKRELEEGLRSLLAR